MKNDLRRKNIIILFLCIAITLMSVGFAIVSSALNISGTAQVQSNTWDVHFTNLANKNVTGSPTISTEPIIDSLSTTVSYEISLNQPGDKYSFTVDVVNEGTIDARLDSLVLGGVTTEQDVYVNYLVTGMSENQVLAVGDTETLTISIEYDPNIISSQLPTENQTLSLTATLNFVQNI